MTEHEMVGWHHRLDGHEFEQALGVGDGQGSLACCSPWGLKETRLSDWMAEVSLQLILKEISQSNQSLLKEISPEYSLEGLMLKLKLHNLAI